MNSKTIRWTLGVAVMVGAFAALVLAGSATASMSGDVYGGSGTWTINNPTTLDGQTLSVSGNIDLRNTLTVTNATILFTVNNTVFTVYGSPGALTMRGSAIGATSPYRYQMIIQTTAGVVNLQNTTIDRVNNGLQVNGGTATSRYFAYVTITHALTYGIVLTNSGATLFQMSASLDIESSIRTDASGIYSYYYVGSYYIQNYTSGTIYHYLTATGTAVLVNGGSPWLDGVSTHVPDVSQRIDANLIGTSSSQYDYNYSYGCGDHIDKYFSNSVYDYFYPTVDVKGFASTNALFTQFKDVRPPPENFSIDLHWNLVGSYSYGYNQCQYGSYSYSYPDDVYFLNSIQWDTASVIGVYVNNGGLQSLSNLDYSMGKVGITITREWNAAQWAIDYFLSSYSRFPNPQVYALWSLETVTTSFAAAVTPTDFSLTNSLFTGAGVRIDRNYNYNAPAAAGGANNTVFRGTVLIDHVTVANASATAIDYRLTAIAGNTYNRYEYTVQVTNSTLNAAKALYLGLLNRPSSNSNYTASVLIQNDLIKNGNSASGKNMIGVITIDTGGHTSSFGSDYYKADVSILNNTIQNMTGPMVGWAYSDYRFPGGSSLTMAGNTFTDVSYYYTPLAGGGKSAGAPTDAFIKASVETITLRNNVFTNFSFVWGMLGGISGVRSGYEPEAFTLCPIYGPMYGYSSYADYGCSWFYKTPRIDVSYNTFRNVVQDSAGGNTAAFALAAGMGHITFNNNAINNSTALWVQAFLNDYPYYSFPTVDIDITVDSNSISNQSQHPVAAYTHPYKTGQPMRVTHNLYFDSSAPMLTWRKGWYAGVGGPSSDYGATFVFTDNVARDITLGGEGVARLTGHMTITNNSFDYVTGWAIIAELMAKIPSLAGNTITHSTDGFWLAPAVVSGLVQTGTFTDLTVAVTDTGIRMENGNLIMLHADFGDAVTAVDMRNGYAEIYSSKIRVLSGRVSGSASITVYNNVGYEVHWADASGQDSGVLVKNALVVTSTVDQRILNSGHTDALGRIAPQQAEVWSLVAFGAQTVSSVALPFSILCFYGGITTVVSLPKLGPGEVLEFFQDYDAYPLLLVDPLVPEITIGKPLAGETVGVSDVTVSGYTFERGSGIGMARLRVDGGSWVAIPTGSATWSVVLPGLGEGRHVLEYEVSDIATNTYSSSLEFFVDLTAPTLTLSNPLEESTLTNVPVFDIRGHVEPATSSVALNGIAVTVNSRGDFFYNYSLADGLNVLRFTATDAARNVVVVSRQIDFDRYAPFLQVTGPVNGLLTNVRAVDVFGRSERDALVTVNGLPAFVNPIDGTFVLPEVALDDIFDQTENLLVIRAVDRAGNVQFENRTVIVDTKAPSIDLSLDDSAPDHIGSKIAAGDPVKVTSLNVRGITDSNDAVITIAGQEVPLAGLSFSRVLVLREGLNLITVTSRDNAGNTRTLTQRVTRDTVAPTLTLRTPSQSNLLTNQSQILVTGFTDAPDATIYIKHTTSVETKSDIVLTVAVGVPIEYRFEYMLELDTDGNSHAVEVRASDLAGNSDTARFDYTAKVNPPALDILGFKETTTDTFVYINGSTDPGIDHVRINGQDFDVVGQYFSVRWNLPIQDGNYTFSVSVRDAAGNTNLWKGTVAVHALPPPTEQARQPGVLDNPTVQVGIGAGIFAFALAMLGMVLVRRRQVE
jgi:hypothetical protein